MEISKVIHIPGLEVRFKRYSARLNKWYELTFLPDEKYNPDLVHFNEHTLELQLLSFDEDEGYNRHYATLQFAAETPEEYRLLTRGALVRYRKASMVDGTTREVLAFIL